MNIALNPILNTDSYKASQYCQYPPKTTYISSYVEARGGIYPETVFFGLQYFLKTYMTTQITQSMIDQADMFFQAHGEPFNREGWQYIVDKHNGYFPIRIKALPEGTVVPISNVLACVENTDPECYWLTSYIETALLRAIWYPTTVATKSRETKKLIKQYLDLTAVGDNTDSDFSLHDFGSRGVSSYESSGIGGMAHLVNFCGSDNIIGIQFAMEYYNESNMVGFSVPAAEHSTITSWGRENESAAYRNMFEQFGKDQPIISVVSDSYDIFNATENIWGTELKEMVIKSGSTLVIRPDSGDPATVVLKIAQLLDSTYGSEVNDKGYKVLNHTRILQGDGLNKLRDFRIILETLSKGGFSTCNVVFGQGGGLLQQVHRDDCKFAMKASYACIDGVDVDVYKDPVTDSGKRSKRGKLAITKLNDMWITDREENIENDLLIPVYENGVILKQYTFSQVRENCKL